MQAFAAAHVPEPYLGDSGADIAPRCVLVSHVSKKRTRRFRLCYRCPIGNNNSNVLDA
jgi:hypothetical protein